MRLHSLSLWIGCSSDRRGLSPEILRHMRKLTRDGVVPFLFLGDFNTKPEADVVEPWLRFLKAKVVKTSAPTFTSPLVANLAPSIGHL